MRRLPLRYVPPELFLAAGLIIAPFVLGEIGASPGLLSRALIWGIIGLGFDLLFGITGLLSFGQTIFYGTGGFVTAYLLINGYLANVYVGLVVGTTCAMVLGGLIGALVVGRSGIYFAMVTVAFAEFAYFLEFSPLSAWTGGENGLAGVPQPAFVSDPMSMYGGLAALFVAAYWLTRHIKEAPFGLILRAIKRNNSRTAAVGHNVWLYRFGVFCMASAYAGLAGGLLGVFQTYMPPDAFTVDASVQLVVQTVIGGVGTLIGPLIGAFVWLYLRTVLQLIPGIGALWKMLLAVVFVLCIVFLPQGIAGTVAMLASKRRRRRSEADGDARALEARHAEQEKVRPQREPVRAVSTGARVKTVKGQPILRIDRLSRRFGGLVAVNGVSFEVAEGGIVALIGPNGAGKSTLFSMLSGEVAPSAGSIKFKGTEIAGIGSTRACQLGIGKSYQITQLFHDMSVRDNVKIPVLARHYGAFSLNTLGRRKMPWIDQRVDATLEEVGLGEAANLPVGELPYGGRRRLEIGLALAGDPDLLLLDEPLAGLSPAERADMKVLIGQIAAGHTVLIVEHDMDAVFELAGRIVVLHRGEIIFDGVPEEMRGNQTVRSAYLGRRALRQKRNGRVGMGAA